MLLVSVLLVFSELGRWWRGNEHHNFAVEKGVGHNLQINIDIVLSMACDDIHINVQDAAGDRVLAAQLLKRDSTRWEHWVDRRGVHKLGRDENGKVITGVGWHDHDEGFGEEHVHDIVAGAGKRAKWARTPWLGRSPPDSCRIFGSLSVNKVLGDFHITARGHGYQEFTPGFEPVHLQHEGILSSSKRGKNIVLTAFVLGFNFSHIISELSFGTFYPSLVNPLDATIATTPNHFHRFQYFLSVVPTVYTVVTKSSFGLSAFAPTKAVVTNQYAVTEQSMQVGEQSVPGIFFKYDIEPMLLTVEESRDSFLKFCLKLVNVLSGVLVAGHWGNTISEWLVEVLGRRGRRKSEGVLDGSMNHREDEE
jgi:hypothetical protein